MKKLKKTVVIGASDNPDRYAYKATAQLNLHGYEVVPVGLTEGTIGEIKVLTGFPEINDVDTVSVYVSKAKQAYWRNYIFNLKPKRIIFNPGTENTDLAEEAKMKGMEVLEACTLVMLSVGIY